MSEINHIKSSSDHELALLRQRIAELEALTEKQKILEASLRRETNFNISLFKTTPAFIVLMDAKGRVVMMNDTMLTALGYSAEEVKGVDYISKFVPKRDAAMLSEIFKTLVTLKESTVNENYVLAKNGRELLIEWHGNQIFDDNDEFEFFFGVGIDISDRKRSQEAQIQMERIKREMELARKIQTSLLPDITKNIHPDFQISAEMLTADQVGGDYYDITYDRQGNLWLSIGDVSGHGVTPGLIMMMAQTVHITVTANLDCDARDVIIKNNEILFKNVHERLNENHFMTLSALKYLGQGRFQHAGAHLSMIVYRQQTKSCELIKTQGIYLNFIKNISKGTKNAEFQLSPNDFLILYTDGITEAHNKDGQILDIQGFINIIESHAYQEVDSMKDLIIRDVMNWCDNTRLDDMSIIIVKMKGD